MLVVQAKPTGPVWTPVMGAEVLFAPIDRPMVLRARRKVRAVSQEAGEDIDTLDVLDLMGDAMSRALITEGTKDWRGVLQQRLDDAGEPLLDGEGAPIFDALPFSAEMLAAALADPVTFDAFDAAYVVPYVMRERERAAPGNGSPASPNGIGEAGMPASNIATSRASRRKGAAARNARTSSTKHKPKPKRTSGAS